jgi:hypothetical protein
MAVRVEAPAMPETAAPARRRGQLNPHVRAIFEAFFFVLVPLIGPAMIFEYLVGAYHVHPFHAYGQYFPDGGFLFDLHVLWKAGHDIVMGHSPYPFVYPAPAALLMVPFGALPWKFAVVAFGAVVVGAVYFTLRTLGVRDWRCYGVALAWMPTTSTLTLGAFSTLLALAAAVAWRYRDRRWIVASAVVFAVVTKLFLWPLVIWLIATRRIRTAVSSVVLGIVVVLGSWAVIGFDGMLDYPHHLGSIAGTQQGRSYSPFAVMRFLGMSSFMAHVGLVALAVIAVVGIFIAARRNDGDRRAFVLALAAALVLSPIVWLHYLVLLYVFVALYRKSLGIAWIIPLAYWLLPGQDSHGSGPALLLFYAITAAAVVCALYHRRAVVLRPVLNSQ